MLDEVIGPGMGAVQQVAGDPHRRVQRGGLPVLDHLRMRITAGQQAIEFAWKLVRSVIPMPWMWKI